MPEAAARGLGDTWRGLREGAGMVFEGIARLRAQRSLWLLALVPVLFSLVFVSLAIAFFVMHLGTIHAGLVAWLPVLEAGAWWSWLWVGPGQALLWLLGWLGVLAAFAVSLVAALLLANLASAPFLDRLSEHVETLETGRPIEPVGGLRGLLASSVASFAAELRRVVFLAGVWLLLSGIGLLVPGGQLLTGPLLVAVTMLFLPLDYAGFALDRRGVSFRDRRLWLWANWPLLGAFGAVGFLACLVPGLNLLLMPAQVTAGTLLVVRRSPGTPAEPRAGA